MNKVTIVALCVLACITYANAAPCYAYKCVSNLTAPVCQSKDEVNKIWFLQTCPSGQSCTINAANFSQRVCVTTPTVPTVTPTYYLSAKTGESCTVNTDCASNLCTSGKCAVVAAGGDCTSSCQCDKGMQCRLASGATKLTCVVMKKPDEACTLSSDCIRGSQCATVGTETTSKCVRHLSVATGTKVVRVGSTSASTLCQSGQYDTATQTCKAAETLAKGYPFACDVDADCASNTGSSGSCVCGGNESGAGFANNMGKGSCSPFAGDLTDKANSMRSYYSRDFSQCYPYEWDRCEYSPTSGKFINPSRYDSNCQEPDEPANKWPSSFSAESCYHDVGIHDYDTHSSAAILKASIFAVALFIFALF